MKLDTPSTDLHRYSPNKSILWKTSRPSCKRCANYVTAANQFTFVQKTLPNQEGSSSRPTLLSSWNLKQNHNRAWSKWNFGQPFAKCMKDTKVLRGKLSWSKVPLFHCLLNKFIYQMWPTLQIMSWPLKCHHSCAPLGQFKALVEGRKGWRQNFLCQRDTEIEQTSGEEDDPGRKCHQPFSFKDILPLFVTLINANFN